MRRRGGGEGEERWWSVSEKESRVARMWRGGGVEEERVKEEKDKRRKGEGRERENEC